MPEDNEPDFIDALEDDDQQPEVLTPDRPAPEPAPRPVPAAPVTKALAIAPTGEVVISDASQLQRLFGQLLKSRVLPDHIKTPEQLLVAHQLITGLGVKAWITALGDTWVNPKTGKMSVCNDLPLAACQLRKDEYEDIEQVFLNANGEPMSDKERAMGPPTGARCIAHRKGRQPKVGEFFKWEAEMANLMHKDNYSKWLPRMYVMRARSIALKAQWADVLKGARLKDYDEVQYADGTWAGEGGQQPAQLTAKQKQLTAAQKRVQMRQRMEARLAEAEEDDDE